MTPDQLQAESEFICAWLDELVSRMQRAQALAEGVGLRPELHQAVQAEAFFFIRICRALTEQTPGSLVGKADRADHGVTA
jgi:hypothetical protein